MQSIITDKSLRIRDWLKSFEEFPSSVRCILAHDLLYILKGNKVKIYG